MKVTLMDFEFLARVRKMSIILGLILFPGFWAHMGIVCGAGWIIGIAWSLINIHVITDLIRRTFITTKRAYPKIALVFLIKFPVLYLVGYLILQSALFPLFGLLAGFIWPFFVMTMKALGRVYMKLDETEKLSFNRNRP